MKNAVITAAFVYHTANREQMLPRKPLPQADGAAAADRRSERSRARHSRGGHKAQCRRASRTRSTSPSAGRCSLADADAQLSRSRRSVPGRHRAGLGAGAKQPRRLSVSARTTRGCAPSSRTSSRPFPNSSRSSTSAGRAEGVVRRARRRGAAHRPPRSSSSSRIRSSATSRRTRSARSDSRQQALDELITPIRDALAQVDRKTRRERHATRCRPAPRSPRC